MHADEIRAHLRTEPFHPIRVYLTDGASYEIRHPENAAVSRRYLFIALPDSNDDAAPERSVFCDPLHVTRIEPLTNGQRKKAAKKRKKRGS